jgi:multisubunit Na+/H+ antiporter MnhF subunit
VNAFMWASVVLIAAFVPLGAFALVAGVLDAVVALTMCGTVATLALLCLGEAFHRSSYFDLPVLCAATTCVGGLIFARFLGRTHE